jgi:hypothetical protein
MGRKRHKRNPGSLTGKFKSALGMYNKAALKQGALITAGALGNRYLSSMIGPRLGVSGQFGSYGVALGTATLLGALGNFAGVGKDLFTGGVVDLFTRVYTDYGPSLSGLGRYIGGMLGMGDVATLKMIRNSQPIMGSMGDFATGAQLASSIPLRPGMGDFATGAQLRSSIPIMGRTTSVAFNDDQV